MVWQLVPVPQEATIAVTTGALVPHDHRHGARRFSGALPGPGANTANRVAADRNHPDLWRHKMKRALFMLLAAIAVLGAPDAAGASGRSPVDPAIMQPPLNPTFDWSCWRTDSGTVCDGERHLSWAAADTEIPCGEGTIYSTGTDDRFLRRWGDEQGRALRSHGVGNITETFALTPGMTGTTARAIGRFSQRFGYAVPGDLSTRFEILSGIDVTVLTAGAGLVMHDVGVKSFDIDDNALLAHGQHEVLEDFDAAFAKVCNALQS